MRWIALFVLALSATACAPEPRPDAPSVASVAAAARGLTIAEKWCTDCHLVRPEQRRVQRPEMRAPDFASVAARPEINAGYLSRFMEVQHLPMPTYRLYSDERGDVVAYILSLKTQR